MISDSIENFYKLGVFNQEDLQLFASNDLLKFAIGGGALGTVGGLLQAKKKIKTEEETLGRPLTKKEKQDIYLMYVGGGAAAGAGAGALAKYALNPNTKSAHGYGPLGTADRTVQSAAKLYKKIDKTKDRIANKWLRGISYEDQDIFKRYDDQLVAYGELIKNKNAWDMTDTERSAFDAMRTKKLKLGAAREAMLVGGGMLALNQLIKPIITDLKNKKKTSVSDDQLYQVALNLKQQGKSEEEIKKVLKTLINNA